ncbi:hypothetical protein BT96DRAFT_565821 [Gymnopus androsaceus JB14]|uniref:Uncharacterized protein n=1 Tax=Gymnopus androsaceus JB14 TaxID=1447944 RepID=A0A6A4HW28_9AGAR|nr:hypothetical protein BT96DRAFT_565821 [Gymnopus androsaceus JB14]
MFDVPGNSLLTGNVAVRPSFLLEPSITLVLHHSEWPCTFSNPTSGYNAVWPHVIINRSHEHSITHRISSFKGGLVENDSAQVLIFFNPKLFQHPPIHILLSLSPYSNTSLRAASFSLCKNHDSKPLLFNLVTESTCELGIFWFIIIIKLDFRILVVECVNWGISFGNTLIWRPLISLPFLHRCHQRQSPQDQQARMMAPEIEDLKNLNENGPWLGLLASSLLSILNRPLNIFATDPDPEPELALFFMLVIT